MSFVLPENGAMRADLDLLASEANHVLFFVMSLAEVWGNLGQVSFLNFHSFLCFDEFHDGDVPGELIDNCLADDHLCGAVMALENIADPFRSQFEFDTLLAESMTALGDDSRHVVVQVEGLIADLAFGKIQFESTLVHSYH